MSNRDLTVQEMLAGSYSVSSGGIDVNLQDQVSAPFAYYLMNEQKKDITLTAPISQNDTTISVSAGHGFTTDSYCVIWDGSTFEQLKVTAVAVNDITLEMPLPKDYTVADTEVWRGSIEMAVDGSVTPVDFKFSFGSNALVPIDITSALITMQHASAGADNLFGGITALTNGFYFRKENTLISNLANYKNNQDFFEKGASVEYTDRSGGGTYGTNIFFELNNPAKFGIVLRMMPAYSDIIYGRVRDNLTALSRMRVAVIGQYTQGE